MSAKFVRVTEALARVRAAERAAKASGRRVIPWAELRRLTLSNSKRLPQYVEINGRRREWVGFGFVDVGAPTGKEPLVVE